MRNLLMLFVLSVSVNCVLATDPVTLNNVVDPGTNDSTEALSESFSLSNATHFLDSVSLQWQKRRQCFTCHTNLAYLYARPFVSHQVQAHSDVRNFADTVINETWPEAGPRSTAEVVGLAAALSFNDANSTGVLHATTKKALNRMWSLQRDDGGWDWIKCGWAPFEYDDHYGVTLAAIAVGVAPDEYGETAAARKGFEGIRRFLAAHPPQNLHHQAMLLWASSYHSDLMNQVQRETFIANLFSQQKDDGGWAAGTLGPWKRHDGSEQDTETSDGYGTGFVLFVLRTASVPASDPRIQRGVGWLKKNQRVSGRWFTRSLFKDRHHFLSHTGSAFAVMALVNCDVR